MDRKKFIQVWCEVHIFGESDPPGAGVFLLKNSSSVEDFFLLVDKYISIHILKVIRVQRIVERIFPNIYAIFALLHVFLVQDNFLI